MNKKNLLIIGIGVAVVGLGIGIIFGLQQIGKTEITTAQPEENNQAEIISPRLTPEQALTEYNQTRTAEQREEVIEKIKAVFGEDLKITFKEAKTRYYSYGIPDPIITTDFAQLKVFETYKDNRGFITEVNAETNEILKREKSCTQETQWITLDQAKEIARNLLAKIVENPDDYALQEDKGWAKVYWAFWRKQNEEEFYNLLPAGKGQELAKREERTIAICLLNGELLSYEYKPALTEKEITEMVKQWKETQKKDIEALRKFLDKPTTEFTFINWVTYGTKQREIENKEGEKIIESYNYKTFRVYRDENGYCYDVDDNRNITPNTEAPPPCKLQNHDKQ